MESIRLRPCLRVVERYCIFQRNQREASLGALFPKKAIIDRLYQIECVKRTCENFDKRRRETLLIQATGTGKTRVAVALSELMIRAKWRKRILFLCDRRELRKQAGNTFDEFLPSEPRDIFRWFDCYQVGLTATPVKFIFRNTYQLFGCENEDPTANYTYDEAITAPNPRSTGVNENALVKYTQYHHQCIMINSSGVA